MCEHYGLKKEDIVNFGANVNPLGLPKQVKKALAAHSKYVSLPTGSDYPVLKHTLHILSDPEDFILPGNGSVN